MEVMPQLVHNNELEEERDGLEEEREEEREELEEEREKETRMDIQKVGQMMETAQKWTYISIAAILVWKIVGATWKQCAPAVQEQTAAPAVQEKTAAPKAVRPKRDPFYME